MTFEYDSAADALYIRLRDGGQVERTEQLGPGTLVDLDKLGRAIGIELIRPARLWPLFDITERFAVEESDAEVLASLWSDKGRYPFAPADDLAAAAS